MRPRLRESLLLTGWVLGDRPSISLGWSGLLGLLVFLGGVITPGGLTLAQLIPNGRAPGYQEGPPPPSGDPLPTERLEVQQNSLTPDYRVSSLLPDRQGNLWVGTWQGLARMNPHTGVINTRVNLPNSIIGAVVQDKSQRIWVGTYEGLKRIDPNTAEITAQNFLLPSNRVLRYVKKDSAKFFFSV